LSRRSCHRHGGTHPPGIADARRTRRRGLARARRPQRKVSLPN
jgi:hypothetical protein